MDAHKATPLRNRLTTVPRIARREQWEAAGPSRLLNLGLGAAWLGFLYTLGLFTTSGDDTTDPLTFADTLALMFFLVILAGIFAVVAMALTNQATTAPVSALAGLAIIVLGATCGFAGHPVSAWGPDVGLAAVIVAASLGVMGRRAPAA